MCSSAMAVENVFIFNKIENNGADISLLTKTFTGLGCSVVEVKNNTLHALEETVKGMMSDFSNYNYVIVIVLDNTNTQNGVWVTTDNKNFFINGDLFIKMLKNGSLQGKFRLGILQTNRLFPSDLAVHTYTAEERRKKKGAKFYQVNDARLYATSLGAELTHTWAEGEASPFIRILCEEFGKTVYEPKPIEDILNRISTRVEMETGELPAKEMSHESFIFGPALVEPAEEL